MRFLEQQQVCIVGKQKKYTVGKVGGETMMFCLVVVVVVVDR